MWFHIPLSRHFLGLGVVFGLVFCILQHFTNICFVGLGVYQACCTWTHVCFNILSSRAAAKAIITEPSGPNSQMQRRGFCDAASGIL